MRIVAGMAAGIVGIVHGKWPTRDRNRPVEWVVRSDDLVRQRTVREDYLEVVS